MEHMYSNSEVGNKIQLAEHFCFKTDKKTERPTVNGSLCLTKTIFANLQNFERYKME